MSIACFVKINREIRKNALPFKLFNKLIKLKKIYKILRYWEK